MRPTFILSTMELTTGQKARVFAQHIGCALSVPDKPKEHWYPFDQNEGGLRLEGVIGGRIFVHRIAETVTDKYRQCYLLLRPLSAITDEDAIEVGKLIGFSAYRHKYQHANGRAFCLGIEQLPPVQFHHLNTYFAIQFLIQRGYAVPTFVAPNHPLNGKTAIEMGLAIDITTAQ